MHLRSFLHRGSLDHGPAGGYRLLYERQCFQSPQSPFPVHQRPTPFPDRSKEVIEFSAQWLFIRHGNILFLNVSHYAHVVFGGREFFRLIHGERYEIVCQLPGNAAGW